MGEQEAPSSGRLFIDAFLDKDLVKFGDCSAYYERLKPDELLQEANFLLSKDAMAIPFELVGNRYYAFLVSLIDCAANFKELADSKRSALIRIAIDFRELVRDRTTADKREGFDRALSATLDRVGRFGLFPMVNDLVANGVRNYEGEFRGSPIGEILSPRAD